MLQMFAILGSRPRIAIGTSDVRLSSNTKSIGIHFRRPAGRNCQGIGRARFEMYKRSKWQSRRAKVYRMR